MAKSYTSLYNGNMTQTQTTRQRATELADRALRDRLTQTFAMLPGPKGLVAFTRVAPPTQAELDWDQFCAAARAAR